MSAGVVGNVCNVQQCFIWCDHFTIPPRSSHPRDPFSVLEWRVKLIYIIFSLIASPDVWHVCWWLTGCSINYLNSPNISCVLLRYSWWIIHNLVAFDTSRLLTVLHKRTLLSCRNCGWYEKERHDMWWEVVLICRNNKQVLLHMNYPAPLFGKHTFRCNDRWHSQSRNIHLWYTGNHERMVPQDAALSGWWTH